jgi:hypothetical protein
VGKCWQQQQQQQIKKGETVSGPGSTQAERITALEVQVAAMQKTQLEINDKLDELLTLRNKGIGAFWLASALIGTGFVGFFDILTRKIF